MENYCPRLCHVSRIISILVSALLAVIGAVLFVFRLVSNIEGVLPYAAAFGLIAVIVVFVGILATRKNSSYCHCDSCYGYMAQITGCMLFILSIIGMAAWIPLYFIAGPAFVLILGFFFWLTIISVFAYLRCLSGKNCCKCDIE